jgi:hypothetical protein
MKKYVHHSQTRSLDDISNKIEYGYGSGYINGYISENEICFSKNKE